MEVRNLLSQAILETSSCVSKHSSPRRPTPVVVPMNPPQKPEGSLWPVDTSSQASAEAAEASLEDILASIFPIAAISRTRHITPLVDELELWANANKALEDFLTTKASIDAHRQRAIWELGVVLHQNESQVAESIKKAKAACSQVTLYTQTTCSQLTLQAKTNCSWVILEVKTACSTAVKKAKTTRGHMVQEAKAACSKGISEVEDQRASQAESFQRKHGNICETWRNKSSKRRAEVMLTSSPPVKLPCTAAHQSLKVLWLLPTISYWANTSAISTCPATENIPCGRTASLPLPLPHQCLSSLLDPKDGTLHQILWRVCLWVEPLWRWLQEDPQLQEVRGPPWFRTLKPGCAKAFSPGREARWEFFLKHPTASPQTAPTISQRYFGRWPWAPA